MQEGVISCGSVLTAVSIGACKVSPCVVGVAYEFCAGFVINGNNVDLDTYPILIYHIPEVLSIGNSLNLFS